MFCMDLGYAPSRTHTCNIGAGDLMHGEKERERKVKELFTDET